MLNSLKQRDASFWKDEKEALNFSNFIGMQLMRTKRMKQKYLEGFPDQRRDIAERTWPLLRTFAVTGMGWSLFAQRQEFQFAFLSAPEGTEFITGDQPIRNLVLPAQSNDVALYYPVSPKTAVVFKHRDVSSAFETRTLLRDELFGLNAETDRHALEATFGRSIDVLAEARNYSTI
ncbi:DUF4238 domain-containing protein [Nitrospirillum amazonense]|uniref:DUF4238 domain-containing protein n=1 Tax=Nitrospirillum amazonense TaxID=28077 RepID=UPI0016483F7C|nr:DUF4238 domain-containing protein [Nitrospirillum amazonense]MEC4592974.1 DUF4238 domain-containing protein [Nitrospirillum amazonense]